MDFIKYRFKTRNSTSDNGCVQSAGVLHFEKMLACSVHALLVDKGVGRGMNHCSIDKHHDARMAVASELKFLHQEANFIISMSAQLVRAKHSVNLTVDDALQSLPWVARSKRHI